LKLSKKMPQSQRSVQSLALFKIIWTNPSRHRKAYLFQNQEDKNSHKKDHNTSLKTNTTNKVRPFRKIFRYAILYNL